MPKAMTEKELESSLKDAKRLDEFEFRNEDDEDDWFTAALYMDKKRRVFRVMESSGMNSEFNGSDNIGEWLVDESLDWSKF